MPRKSSNPNCASSRLIFLGLSLFLSLGFSGEGFSGVLHVKHDATGTGDGSSWANAFHHLQDALTTAVDGDEVWVASGTYYPDQGAEQTPGDTLASFEPTSGVSLYGGFAGYETMHEQRTIGIYESILSGKISESSASRNIIRAHNVDNLILDGLTVTGGRGGNGGGMNLWDSSVIVRDCLFNDNSGGLGGAIRNNNSPLVVIRTKFTNNRAGGEGGAIHQGASSLTVEGSSFNGNSGGFGGAISASWASVRIENSTFTSNSAPQHRHGGAIRSRRGVLFEIANCTFEENEAWNRGGAIFIEDHRGPPARITSSVFRGNSGGERGAAISLDSFPSSSLVVRNSLFLENSPGAITTGPWDHQGELTVVNCTFFGNSPYNVHSLGEPAGQRVNNLDATESLVINIQDPAGPDGVFGTSDDGFRLRADSPAIDAGDNAFVEEGEIDLAGSPRILRNRVDLGAYEAEPPMPLFLVEPKSDNVKQGETVVLTARAVGFTPISYRWHKDGDALNDSVKISGSTSRSLTLRDVQVNDQGTYTLRALNDAGMTTSKAATLTVTMLKEPEVHTHPQNAARFLGDMVSLSVAVGGEAPLNYQWYHNGTPIPDATERLLNLNEISSSDAGRYAILVSNVHGSTLSSAAVLTVFEFGRVPPEFILEPEGVSVFQGETARFTAEAAGAPPISYQWVKDGEHLDKYDRFTVTRLADLIITNVQPEDEGTYTLIASNEFGSRTSIPAELTVREVLAPMLLKQPKGSAVHSGERVTLSVTAAGVQPFSYQWYHNGRPLEGATSPQLMIESAMTTAAGQYVVVVRNEHGNVLSTAESLLVHATIALSYDLWINRFDLPAEERGEQANPAGDGLSNLLKYALWLDPRESAFFPLQQHLGLRFSSPLEITDIEITPESSDDLVAWKSMPIDKYFKNEIIDLESGSFQRVLWIKESFKEAPQKFIRARIDRPGALVSTELTVAAVGAPVIHTQPEDITGYLGDTVTLSVGVEGEDPMNYQWYRNGSALGGGNARELKIQSLATSDAGRYAVLVSNSHGSAISEEVVLTVREFERTPPEFIVQPQSTLAFKGQAVALTAEIAGAEPISYQWLKNDQPLQTNGRFSGTDSASLTIEDAQPEDSGTYVLMAINEFGKAASDPAELTVEEVLAPRVTVQPRDTSSHLGEQIILSITAIGVEPLEYQWHHKGLPIEGATERTLTMGSLKTADAGGYAVLVTNTHGSSVSRQAHLMVHPVEAIPYETWITKFGLPLEERREGATPARDGVPNLLKYVFGEQPTQPVGSALENCLVLSFDYAASIVDVDFSLDVSEDGSTWTSIPLDSYPNKKVVELEDGYFYRVYVWFEESFKETTRKSIRLRATR